MNVRLMSTELDSPKERRLLLLGVLLGHALLLGLLALQKANIAPKLLEIELSLSSAEPQSMAQPLAAKLISTPLPTLKPVPVPVPVARPTPAVPTLPTAAPVPTPTQLSAPVALPTQLSDAHSASTSNPHSAQSIASTKTTMPQAAATVLPNADAAYLTNPKPGYPPLSRRLGEQGVVLLSVLVDEGGDVQKLEVTKSSGYTRLDEAASRAVQSWHFAPGKRAGIAQTMWVKVPISFILEK